MQNAKKNYIERDHDRYRTQWINVAPGKNRTNGNRCNNQIYNEKHKDKTLGGFL